MQLAVKAWAKHYNKVLTNLAPPSISTMQTKMFCYHNPISNGCFHFLTLKYIWWWINPSYFAKTLFSFHQHKQKYLKCFVFFNITPLFAMGYISEGERSTVKQLWKICHNFQGSIMQDLPHLYTIWTQPRLSRHTTWIVVITASFEARMARKTSSSMGIEPATLRSKLQFCGCTCKATPQACVLPASGVQRPGIVAGW